MNRTFKRVSIGIVTLVALNGLFLLIYYFVSELDQRLSWELPMWLILSLSLLSFIVIGGFSSYLLYNEQYEFRASQRILKEMAQGKFDFGLSKDAEALRSLDEDWNRFFDQMELTNQSLARMEELKQEFISNVSHEIKTPLTSIVGFTQLAMSETKDSQRRQYYLQTIQDEALRLSELSDSLLKLTKLEDSQQLLQKVPFNIADQLTQILATTASQFELKEIKVIRAIMPLSYVGDQELIYQIWQNIVSNSLKFTPVGGQVTISLQEVGPNFQVSIRDNGIGMSSAERTRIFERFYKADNSRTTKTGGSGLGLSIVDKISDLHQDLTIDVESHLGKGTVFLISGPLAETK